MIRIRGFLLCFLLFLHRPAFCVCLVELNGSLESPPLLRGIPLDVYQISSLSGFLLRAFNFRGRNVITFYSFQTGETQSEDKGEEQEWERRKGTTERKEDEVETSYEGWRGGGRGIPSGSAAWLRAAIMSPPAAGHAEVVGYSRSWKFLRQSLESLFLLFYISEKQEAISEQFKYFVLW